MTRRLVLASRNPRKLAEMRRILGELELGNVEMVGLDAYPGLPEVTETGRTFADNALLKARVVAASTGQPVIAEDSGLCVDALNGMPGVRSARWSGRQGDERANLELLLAQVRDVADPWRSAAFVAAAALVSPDGPEIVQEGRMEGKLIREPRGSGGFGYDPIFVPDGQSRTSAELSAAEKDAISHRGRALRGLAPSIVALLGS